MNRYSLSPISKFFKRLTFEYIGKRKRSFFTVMIALGLPTFLFAQNNALQFDGVNDNVIATGFTAPSSYTMEGWFKPNTTVNQTVFLGSTVSGPTVNIHPGLFIFNGRFGHYIYDQGTGSGEFIFSDDLVVVDQWYHVAIVAQNGGSQLMYVNGILQAETKSVNTLWTGTTLYYLGVNAGASWAAFDGEMDEFRMWSDVRTQTEIQNNMNIELTGSESNLLVYYDFNQTSGTSLPDLASSPSAQDGTLVNFGGSQWVASGVANTSLNFDGTDYVNCGADASLNLTSSMTIELWINPSTAMGQSRWDRLVHRNYVSSYFFGGKNGQTNALAVVLANDLNIIQTPVNTIEVGVWQHVAFTFNDATNEVKIYKNGTEVASASFTGTIPGAPGNFVEISDDAGEKFRGSMDEIRIWNVARTQAEIASNKNLELTGAETGLVAYYRFNEGIANGDNSGIAIPEIQDATSNNNNGTLNGFTKTGTTSNWVAGFEEPSNTAPTASSFTASNGPYDGLTYTFATANFGYSDGDGDLLNHVLIEALPTAGTLYIDANNNDALDGGEAVSVSTQVSKAILDAGNLQYIQNGSTNTSFQFEVNDGTDNSTGNYIATLNISPIPTVTLGISPTSKSESTTTANVVTATLSNVYGANTTVNLAFSGTATNTADYTRSATAITINAGATTGTINLNNVPDALYEGNETVIIDISSVINGTESGTQQVTYTITDDDSQPNASLLLRNIYNPITDESGGQAYIVAELSAIAGVTVTVPLSFSGTATGGGTDYSITGSTIIIPPGKAMDSIRVTSQFDGIEEGNETVIIDMNTPTNAIEDGVQQVTLTINDEDATFPSTSITTGASDPTNSSPFSVTITFNESVTGFTVGDITVGNGAASNFAGSGTTYTADITPAADGTVTVDVGAGVAADAFGNGNTAATQLSRVYDSTSPSVAITTGASDPTNSSPFSATFTFSEVVTGFVIGDITVGNGAASNFAGSGDTYTADITPSGDGTVTVDVGAGVAIDAVGNSNTAATQLSLVYDGTSPTVAITTSEGLVSNNNPLIINIDFSEAVTGFDPTDLSIVNGTFTGGSGTGASYVGEITPTGEGLLTFNIAGGVAVDAAGNTNTAATQLSITYDITSPTVVISTGASDPTDASPFSVTFTFSESVTGFALGDITVGNGAASNFAGSGDTYTADITPSGDGTVTVDVSAGVATDAAGNGNTAATQLSLTYDTTGPTVAISTGASDPTNSSPFSATFTFSEIVTGFALGDITVSNGAASNFAGSGDTYTADITPSGDGTVTVDVGAGVAIDAAGNSNTAAPQLSLTYDGTSPTVSITTGASDPTNSSPFSVTITFSESVTGFALGDITVGNGAASNFAGSGTTYTADITPAGDGAVTIDVGAAVAIDAAGNDNTAAPQLSLTYDGTSPTASITTGASDPTNSSPFSVTITFSEVVTGFAIGDITVGNGSASNFAGSGTTYTADITPAGDGAVTVDVGAGVATDAAGNSNTAATQLSLTYDTTSPTVAISTGASDPTNSSPFSATFTFSESVTGFALADITVGNGSASNFAGTGDTYTADITPSGDGALTIDVGAGLATDASGNSNTAAPQLSLTYDGTSPTASITTGASDPTNSSPFSVTITFSESVTGFALGDITVGNGAASNFAGSGTTYTADITPVGDGAVTVDVGAGVATDAAGNNNTAATQLSLTYDGTSPTASITTGESDPTNSSPFSVTITFSEAVTGFAIGDINVGNGAASNFAGTGDTYTADITPASDGNLTVDVGAGLATDAAGNGNIAATQLSLVYDGTTPSGYTVAIDLLGESQINVINETIIEFNATGLEVGTTLNYSFTSDGGGTPVTGTETVTSVNETFNNGGAGYDLSGLVDGIITLSISLTDLAGNTGVSTTDSETKDAGPPTGYSVAWDDAIINATEASTTTFTISNAEIGTTINATITSSGGGTPVTAISPSTVASSSQIVTVDVSSLTDGTLTVQLSLTDDGGNIGGTVSDNSAVLDQIIPSGYTVAIDQTAITAPNQTAASFTFAGADIGTAYNYAFSSIGGGTDVTGSGTIVTATDQISGIDLSGLGDGTVTLSVTLTDDAGNVGNSATDNVIKDANAPVFVSVDDDGGDNSYRSGESLTIVADLGEAGLTLTADLSVINAGLSAAAAMTDNSNGTYSLTIADLDVSGGMIENLATAITLTATDAFGNQQTDNSLVLLLDKTAPASYSIAVDQAAIDNANHTALSFTFSAAEIGADYDYTITSAGGGTSITGSGTISSATDQISGIDVSSLADGILTVSVTLTDAAGNVGIPATDNVTKTAAEVQFAIITSNGDESVATASIQVELSVVSGQDVTVDYFVTGTATNGTDFTLANGTLTIPSGSVNGTIDIAGIVDDVIAEGDETVIITLSNATNARLATNIEHTYTINDNDVSVLSITATTQATEDDVDGLFTITATKSLAVDVQINFEVAGTATEGTDYNAIGTSITIPAGSSSVTIPVTIIADTDIEGDETVIVTLKGTDNASATIGGSDNATVIITDNDAKIAQTITFETIEDVTLGAGSVTLVATSDSGLPITFSISTQPTTGIASLSGNTILPEGVGTVTVVASQSGNDIYEAASDVVQTFNILSSEFFLPSLFSPNGDGQNDRFILRGSANVASIELSIFDREGNLVFISNDINDLKQNGWDGTSSGKNQSQGAYVWVIKGSLADGTSLLINGKNSGIIRLAR